MNNESDARDRATEFRRSLVSIANLGPYGLRRPSVKVLVALVSAFVLAGALTGGAVAAAAAVDPEVAIAQADAATNARVLVKQLDGSLLGHPFVRDGVGTQIIDLGERPAGATDLAEGFDCLDPGKYVGLLDSKQYEEYPDCAPDGSGGSLDQPNGGGGHLLTIEAPAGARFVIWLSWVKIPVFADSAAEKAELADGTITRDEDVAAFDRYEGCMDALGHPIGLPALAIVPAYGVSNSAVEDGSDNRCYVTEYKGVDERWQLEVEQTDVATASIDACIVEHEEVPAATPAERAQQIQDLDLNLDECMWVPSNG